jgi:glycosyltransferase involved in cell wall biosynthesis
MVTLLRHFDRSRFEPHLALVEKAGPFLEEVPKDVPVYDLEAGRVRYALPGLLRLAWRTRPHALLSTLGELNLAILLGRPLVPRGLRLVIREVTPVSVRLPQQSRHPGPWRRLYRLYSRADKVICVSDFVLNDLAEGFGVPREKMVRIYNPVDSVRVTQLAGAAASPFFGTGPQLVAAGRLSKEKGFDLLVDAMSLVRQTLPHAQLTVLGDGPLRLDLEDQRARLGLGQAVRWVGTQTNPYPFFRHADLYVLTSRFEGLPNVVLEALAPGDSGSGCRLSGPNAGSPCRLSPGPAGPASGPAAPRGRNRQGVRLGLEKVRGCEEDGGSPEQIWSRPNREGLRGFTPGVNRRVE